MKKEQQNSLLRKHCEGLSQKNRRRLLIGLSILYGICAMGTLYQAWKMHSESAEMQQVKKIGRQSIQTDSLLLKKKYEHKKHKV